LALLFFGRGVGQHLRETPVIFRSSRAYSRFGSFAILVPVDLAQIKAITFDAGGTLLEPWPSVGAIYGVVAREFGVADISEEALNEAFGQAWKSKRNFDYSLRAWRSLVEEVFAPLGEKSLAPGFFEALYQRFAEKEVWLVYEDVIPALQRLRESGYRLGVISNWDDRLRPLLSALQLSPYFESIILSVDAGYTKPSPEIFGRALRQFALPARAVLHVGDNLEEDMAGAQGCGMAALLLDRRARAGESIALLTDLAARLRAALSRPVL